MTVEWPSATWFVLATVVAVAGVWLLAAGVATIIESRRDAARWREEEDRIRRRLGEDDDDD